jgi:hypothetical protein
VDFGELNDKMIKGQFILDIQEQLLEYLFMDKYYMVHIGEDKYMDDPYAHWLNVKQ